jgi:predicted transcriptional regulator of viral defense system
VTPNHAKKLVQLSRKLGVLRPRDLEPAGIPRVYLKQLIESGEILKTGRGLYVHADTALTENHTLAEAAKLVPKGVVCLLSALRFHDLTTENPSEVWLAVPRETRRPKSGVPALHTMQFVAKTITDCFRFRNRIGVNIAVEALRDAWQNKKTTSDELWRYAKICRVLNVMRPYFDSLA